MGPEIVYGMTFLKNMKISLSIFNTKQKLALHYGGLELGT
jgi:hypothetical protein